MAEVIPQQEEAQAPEPAQEEILKCKGCKKRFRLSGFGHNRLGEQFKSCIECRQRQVNKRFIANMLRT